jgi:hypothetical protein
MDNRDLIRQYVNTGIGISRYQYDKLNNNNKTSYLKKMEISIKHDARNIQYYYGELPEDVQMAVVQMAAVKQNGFAIYNIKNPTPEALALHKKLYGN